MEISFGQLRKLLHLLEKKGDRERFQHALETGILSDVLEANFVDCDREAVRKALNLALFCPSLDTTLEIDFRKTLEELIRAGQYDWADERIIADDFQKSFRVVDRDVHLLVYRARYLTKPRGAFASYDEAARALENMSDGIRPRFAGLRELLILGAKLSNEELEVSPITALGVCVELDKKNEFCYSPVLKLESGKRVLDVEFFSVACHRNARHLVVFR